MKIAYLILAHANYKHLERLINALQDEDVDFYIHIDKKSKLPNINGNNIFYVNERIKIYHSGFSEIKATLKLLESAFKIGYHKYVLLSGVDYPVKSKTEIKRRLQEDKEFITFEKWPNQYHASSYFKYYYFDCFDRRKPGFKKNFFEALERLCRKFKLSKRFKFTIYSGYQWFALSGKAVQCILEIMEKENKYLKFFKSSRLSSEAFFPTIIGNHYNEQEKIAPYLTFVDFSKGGPAIINANHLEDIKKGNYLFVRKFSDNSEHMISLIKKEFSL